MYKLESGHFVFQQ